jgi:hypothetical protein
MKVPSDLTDSSPPSSPPALQNRSSPQEVAPDRLARVSPPNNGGAAMDSHVLSTFHLRRRTPGTFVLVPFPRQGRSIRCQGQLEAAAAQILAASPRVVEICEQPLAIWYAWDEATGAITLLDGPPDKAFRKRHRVSYVVPDFLLTLNDGARHLVEIKPAEKLDRPLVQRKLTVAALAAKTHAWTYYVVTERHLYGGPLLANVRLLARFRNSVPPPALVERIESVVSQRSTTIEALITECGCRPAEVRATALHLAAAGRVSLDPRFEAVSNRTILYPGGSFLWDPFDSVWEPSGFATNGPSASSANLVPTNSSPKM